LKSRKKNPRKNVEHPSVKRGVHRTASPPLISCGKVETQMMKCLAKTDGERFNMSAFSKYISINRSTIYHARRSLILKGLIDIPHTGQTVLTTKGYHYLNASGGLRTVCSEEKVVGVRDHKFKFEVAVSSFPPGWSKNAVAILNKEEVQTKVQNFSKNNDLFNLGFPDGVDVVVTTTKVLIKPKDIFSQSHSDASALAITKTLDALRRMKEVGFKFEDSKGVLKLIDKGAHYTEVGSLLAEWFEKHAYGYCVFDQDRKPLFWIDHSNGTLEEETSSEEARENLNKNMLSILRGDVDLGEMSQDLDSLKEITANLVRLHLIPLQKRLPDDKLGRPDYYG